GFLFRLVLLRRWLRRRLRFDALFRCGFRTRLLCRFRGTLGRRSRTWLRGNRRSWLWRWHLDFALRDRGHWRLFRFLFARRRRRCAPGFRRGGFAVHPNDRFQIRPGWITIAASERQHDREMRHRDYRNVPPEARVSWHHLAVSAFVAIPTLLICARCNAS